MEQMNELLIYRYVCVYLFVIQNYGRNCVVDLHDKNLLLLCRLLHAFRLNTNMCCFTCNIYKITPLPYDFVYCMCSVSVLALIEDTDLGCPQHDADNNPRNLSCIA